MSRQDDSALALVQRRGLQDAYRTDDDSGDDIRDVGRLTDSSPRPGVGPAAVLMVAMGALPLLYAAAVLTRAGQALDTSAMTAVSAAVGITEWAQVLLEIISPVTLLLGAGALAVSTRRRTGWIAAVVVFAVALVPGLMAHVLKDALGRPALVDAASNSFPSGHVAAVAGLAVASWAAADQIWRPAAAVLGGLAVAATALATITLGWHRPSDVIASMLIAIATGALARLIMPSVAPATIREQRQTVM